MAAPRRARQLDDAAVRALVAATVAGVLGADVGADAPLMEAGLDSLGAVELRNALERETGLALPATLIFDHPTSAAISEFVSAQVGLGV